MHRCSVVKPHGKGCVWPVPTRSASRPVEAGDYKGCGGIAQGVSASAEGRHGSRGVRQGYGHGQRAVRPGGGSSGVKVGCGHGDARMEEGCKDNE